MHRSTEAHRPRMAVFATALLLVAALVLLSASAAARADDEAPAAGQSTLRLGWTAEPDNLNPFIGWASASFEVWTLNYDQLVGWDPEDFSSVPTGLATSWEVSNDGKTYTFHLRKGVRWQDGQAFTAEDVAFTYNYIIDNDMAAFSMATAGIKEAVVVDAYTVELVCINPKADLLKIWIPILPKHIWEDVPPGKAGTDYVNEVPIVGTGPFQCVEFKKGSYVRMVRNKDYFRGAPHIKEVLFETYQNPDTMTSDLKLGTIDAAQGIPQAQFDALSKESDLQTVAYNYRNWDYLAMNCYAEASSKGHRALQDVKFRQALNWAIDKQRLTKVAWSGHADPATTILPPGQWFNPDYHWQPPAATAYQYDPAKAGELLDAAGYADSDGDGVREYRGEPLTLRLWASSEGAEQQSEAKLIAGELQEIGIKVKLQISDSGVLNDMIWNYSGDAYAPDFDLFVSSWDGYFDPSQTLGCFTSSQVENWNEEAWSNGALDTLWEEQAVTLDTTERQQMIWKMQQLMYEQSPEVVLTYPQYFQAYNTAKWTGWVRVFNGKGPAFYIAMPDTYLNVRPVATTTSESNTALWIGVAAAAVVVVGAAIGVLVWRRRRAAEPDEE